MEEKMGVNLQQLNRCSKQTLVELLHEVIDFICLNKEPSSEKYKNHWNSKEWENLVNGIKDVFLWTIKRGSDELPPSVETLDQNIRQEIQKSLAVRREDVKKYVLEETCNLSETWLKDFDWKVKLILASDSLSSVKQPLMSLDLELQQEKSLNIITLELTKEELRSVITTLETTQKALVQLKA